MRLLHKKNKLVGMEKVYRKFIFIFNIVALGADIRSKTILLLNNIIIQKNLYINSKPRSFHAKIKVNGNNANVHFQGTLDEMHALTEIFIEKCYNPTQKDINKILDLGANIGLASIWFTLKFPKAIIHAYEPNPIIYPVLKKNLEPFKNIKCFNEAIGDAQKGITFYISKRSFSSSAFPITQGTPIQIKSQSLDKAIERINGKVDLLKIDIEGAEYQAFKKATKMEYIYEIVGELHPDKTTSSPAEMEAVISKTHVTKDALTQNKSLFRAVRI